MTAYDVVIPSVGRPQLADLLRSLDREAMPRPQRVIVVDDRQHPTSPLSPPPLSPQLADRVRVIRSGGHGPAAARNIGWRASASPWVVFLDDDVVVAPGWGEALTTDLSAPDVVGTQGRIVVPLPTGRKATDWERNVAGLASAWWATADMAYRREALSLVGGFDERFPRPLREDADLALRLLDHGLELRRGNRVAIHPVGPDRPLGALSRQAGNADDVLMLALHGRDWRERAGAPRGRRAWHAVTTIALLALFVSKTTGARATGRLAATMWLALTLDYGWRRFFPGPLRLRELVMGGVTTVLIPPVAIWHWVRGWVRLPFLLRSQHDPPRPGQIPTGPVAAVLFDRDGTLIVDVPYCGDPNRVRPKPGAKETLDALRRRGVKVAVVTNQSGIGRGLITAGQAAEVNRRVEHLLGPFDAWGVCPHHPEAGCSCRKPEPGLVEETARRLAISPQQCAVVGDIGADLEAAARAGATAILVPTESTLPEEVRAAHLLAADLEAVGHRLAAYLPTEAPA